MNVKEFFLEGKPAKPTSGDFVFFNETRIALERDGVGSMRKSPHGPDCLYYNHDGLSFVAMGERAHAIALAIGGEYGLIVDSLVAGSSPSGRFYFK